MISNALMRSLATAVLVGSLAACGEGESAGGSSGSSGSGGSSGSEVEGSFRIEVSNGSGFSDQTDRASVEVATDSMFGFKARGWQLRIDARDLPDTGAAETTEFGGNNTMLTLSVDMDGERRRVGCDPADPEVGTFERTKLTETEVSGEFSMEFVTCEDYYSVERVEVPGLPFTVTGSFEDIQRTDQ